MFSTFSIFSIFPINILISNTLQIKCSKQLLLFHLFTECRQLGCVRTLHRSTRTVTNTIEFNDEAVPFSAIL